VLAGDYVRCNFPFRESRGPGPSSHIVLCLGKARSRGVLVAIVAYTTTRVAFEGERRPRQHLFVDAANAAKLGQSRPFHVDVSRVARLPVTLDYFPDLQQNGSIRTFGQDPTMVTKVIRRQQELIGSGYQLDAVDLASPVRPKP
jgi:hypothetical protein